MTEFLSPTFDDTNFIRFETFPNFGYRTFLNPLSFAASAVDLPTQNMVLSTIFSLLDMV